MAFSFLNLRASSGAFSKVGFNLHLKYSIKRRVNIHYSDDMFCLIFVSNSILLVLVQII